MNTRRGAPGLVLPAILVAIGVVALLANGGVISSVAMDNLLSLWPLILVVLGIELVLRGTTNPVTASRVGLVVVALTAVAAVTFASLAPAQIAGERTADFSAPVGSLQKARLALEFGGADVTIKAASSSDAPLYQAHVSYSGSQEPTANLDRGSGTVTIALPQQGFTFGSNRRVIDVSLSPQVTWDVRLAGGATRATLNLASMTLAGLKVSGGAANCEVTLPAATGNVPVTFEGGATSITLHRPAATGMSVAVQGGASSLSADGHQSSAVGEVNWQSDNFDTASGHYTVTVSGGANHVVADTRG